MSVTAWGLLLFAGVVAGMINSVSSGGSFFTYPALVVAGLSPISAAATTLAALVPGNMAAIPEYLAEARQEAHRYPEIIVVTVAGSLVGIVLLLATGADVFTTLVPWLILLATAVFAFSPNMRQWAERKAPGVTNGRAGLAILFPLAVYLTYFGSGAGSMILAFLVVRGFPDFLSANVAKNVLMTLGPAMAAVAYTLAGLVSWSHAAPVLIGSAVGARLGSKLARFVPQAGLRLFVIAFGLFVAGWQFAQ